MKTFFAWLHSLYHRILLLSGHPKAEGWLAGISFVESSIFPIPPDVLLLPMCLANRARAFRYALVCTIASVLGGLLGYAIGVFAYDTVGHAILELYGISEKYEMFREWYIAYGAIMVFIAGFTPIPYKVITISAGVFGFNLGVFIVLSLASRGLRFVLEAFLIWRFGEPAMAFIEKHFNKLTILGAVLLVGGFLILKIFLPHG